MTRSYTTLITLLIASSFARAQEAQKLSLQDCINYAQEHNYSIKNAQVDVLIQAAQNAQTASIAYPTVSAKAEFDDFLRPQRSFINAKAFGGPDMITSVAFTVPYAASAGLSASQLIFDGSAMIALQARKMALELSKQSAAVTIDNVRYNIFKSYYTLAVAYKQREILASSLATLRDMMHDLTVTEQSGFVEKIDVERSSVQLNNMGNDSVTLENGIRLYEYALKFAIGMDINKPITLTDTALDSHFLAATNLLLEGDSYERVPDYIVLNTFKSLMDFNVRRYKLSALPSLAAFGAWGTNYGSDKFNDMWKFKSYEANSTVGLQLSVPIFNGFARVNRVKEAKLNVEKATNNINNLKLAIDFTAAQARGTLKNSMLQIRSQTVNLTLAKEVVDLAQKKFKAGVGSNMEVTQAQGELLKAQNSYFSTLVLMISAEADLKKALGLF